ncbi:MAG: response regulator, partial [Desulfohalobiaceae bacterium]|nr:response regulator [Desulfohalobiaceae bacterium]
ISLESDPEQGSSLQVFLPIVPDETPGQRETAEESKEFPGQGAVLLVEDQDSVRKIVKNMLEHLGFEVLAAREGSEAIEIFRNNTEAVACVLTDLSMPGMDGWETLEALRKIDPGIPAILASGYDQTRVMAGNHEELPQGFLAKPYQLSELKSTLARILQEKTS